MPSNKIFPLPQARPKLTTNQSIMLNLKPSNVRPIVNNKVITSRFAVPEYKLNKDLLDKGLIMKNQEMGVINQNAKSGKVKRISS